MRINRKKYEHIEGGDTSQIVFLDVDGVLTSRRCNGYFDFDLWAVTFLRWVCEVSDTKIVMSSAWRTMPDAKKIFTKTFGNRLHKDWRTGDVGHRGEEIDTWLKFHPEVENYVVIDDDKYDLYDHSLQLVFTTIENGMLWEHMDMVRKLLNIRKEMPMRIEVFNDPVCFYKTREKNNIGYQKFMDDFWGRNGRKLAQEAADEVD